jgi:hypothetical protein
MRRMTSWPTRRGCWYWSHGEGARRTSSAADIQNLLEAGWGHTPEAPSSRRYSVPRCVRGRYSPVRGLCPPFGPRGPARRRSSRATKVLREGETACGANGVPLGPDFTCKAAIHRCLPCLTIGLYARGVNGDGRTETARVQAFAAAFIKFIKSINIIKFAGWFSFVDGRLSTLYPILTTLSSNRRTRALAPMPMSAGAPTQAGQPSSQGHSAIQSRQARSS